MEPLKQKFVETIPLTPVAGTRQKNRRLVLYIFYIPLLLLEWSVTLVFNVVEQIANAITELTLSLKRFIHAEAKPADTKQPDTK